MGKKKQTAMIKRLIVTVLFCVDDVYNLRYSSIIYNRLYAAGRSHR